jgi:hypothetical protein
MKSIERARDSEETVSQEAVFFGIASRLFVAAQMTPLVAGSMQSLDFWVEETKKSYRSADE